MGRSSRTHLPIIEWIHSSDRESFSVNDISHALKMNPQLVRRTVYYLVVIKHLRRIPRGTILKDRCWQKDPDTWPADPLVTLSNITLYVRVFPKSAQLAAKFRLEKAIACDE